MYARNRPVAVTVCMLLFASLASMFTGVVSADNTMQTATTMQDGDVAYDYICWPTCSSGSVDRYDWYKIYLYDTDVLQVYFQNNGTPTMVDIEVQIRDSSNNTMTMQYGISGSNITTLTVIVSTTKSALFSPSLTGWYYIMLTTVDGWQDDDTYYELRTYIQDDNSILSSIPWSVGLQGNDGYLCYWDCSTVSDRIDQVDWFEFWVGAGESIGISVYATNYLSNLDWDLYRFDGTNLSAANHDYFGGGSDQWARGWFNESAGAWYYLKIYATNSVGEDYTFYNLSVSSGDWYDVAEDSYVYFPLEDVRPGDIIKAHAIRTTTPNDLDILLYNESEFHDYRDYVIGNHTGTGSSASPSELMAEQDCLVCYVEYDLTDEQVGQVTVTPDRSLNRSTSVSWTPTFYLVADYTDYLQWPPWDGFVNIAHVFLSLQVERAPRVNHYYTIESLQSGSWVIESTGSTNNSTIHAPAGGWDASKSFVGQNHSETTYRITVRNGSTSGSLVTQSNFTAVNLRPVSCLQTTGIETNMSWVHHRVSFDSSCSSDPDSVYPGQGIVNQTIVVDGMVYHSTNVQGVFNSVGTHTIQVNVTDESGLQSSSALTINISSFPTNQYQSVATVDTAGNFSVDRSFSVQQNLTWKPTWADLQVKNLVLGIGMVFYLDVTHNANSTVSLSSLYNSTHVGADLSMLASNDSYIVSLQPMLQFYWVNTDDGQSGKFEVPMPSSYPVYPNQPSIWLPDIGLIYYWNDSVQVGNSGNLVNQYGIPYTNWENISISAVDLYPYITDMVNRSAAGVMATAFLSLIVDIELILDFNIMLQQPFDEVLYAHVTSTGNLTDSSSAGEGMIEFEAVGGGAFNIYSNHSSSTDILNVSGTSTNPLIQLYPYTYWNIGTNVYGAINLTLNLKNPGWLDWVPQWLIESPTFWNYSKSFRLFQSTSPIATGSSSGVVYSGTSAQLVMPDWDTDSVIDVFDQDDDDDGLSDILDDCPRGESQWSSGANTDHDGDGCRDATEDDDDDADSIEDSLDSCPRGEIGWTPSSQSDFDGDGCQDSTEDTDDDSDTVPDVSDLCQTGTHNWISSPSSDYDGDGCRDYDEDDDDDGDGLFDSLDDCLAGAVGWQSTPSTDHDSDGCEDQGEDSDDDNDGVPDSGDDCALGALNWTSDSLEDYDADGCRDEGEDPDDDDDTVIDELDTCSRGQLNWASTDATDHDGDGCRDSDEDDDDDNDGVLDTPDSCHRGELGWTSAPSNDHDGDGCLDSIEDIDDDDDGIPDQSDSCPRGMLQWLSTSFTDHDSDGCADESEEDYDDDGDGVLDGNDSCPKGSLDWSSDDSTDYDSDGCQDADPEDQDDDNDAVTDELDSCPQGELGIVADQLDDRDADGCRDATEDDDDDGDGVLDFIDACPKGQLNWISDFTTDHDGDGCNDDSEDNDDDDDSWLDADEFDCLTDMRDASDQPTDHDGDRLCNFVDTDDDNDDVADEVDGCPLSESVWSSDAHTDFDSDGCRDSGEDLDDDADGTSDDEDACPLEVGGSSMLDVIGCMDSDGDGYADSVDYYPSDSTRWEQSMFEKNIFAILAILALTLIIGGGAVSYMMIRNQRRKDGSGPVEPVQMHQQVAVPSFQPAAQPAPTLPPPAATSAQPPPPAAAPVLVSAPPFELTVPNSGLPPGWTIEQWNHYGQEYLDKQQEDN